MLTIEPTGAVLGATVRGIDLAQTLSESDLGQILLALGRYGVLRFPDQHLDLGELKHFSEQFGEIQGREASAIRGRTVTFTVKFANFRVIIRSRTGQTQITTRNELEQLSNALLEPLFPVARGIRLLGVALSSLAEEAERDPEFSLPV